MKNFLLAALAVLCFSCAARSADSSGVIIQNVAVIDVRNGTVLPGRTVVVRDRQIDGIFASAQALSNKDIATRVDGTGKFLIPGLWDMHVHSVFGDWFPQGKEISLPLFVANGITGVRDMGGELDVLLQWRKEITAGTLVGPRMIIAGPMLDGPKPRFPSSVAITTPEDGRHAVDDLKARGADFINCNR